MSGTKWILLVAGSKGWANYRYQANVCCAYQLMRKQGIPDEQIVVMMYDDIANNAENHFSNSIRSVVDDSNVYMSVPHDYTGDKVNAKKFLDVLQGENSAGGKVIGSGANDNIFIYMSGVGSPSKFNFPGDSLTATDFIAAINQMNSDKKYSKMAIYMDSDFSESMFAGLSEQINVYAVASCDSSNQNTPYPFDNDRSTYLSDQFSDAWLNFISGADPETTTFENMFDSIKKQANSACEKGDKMMDNRVIGEFLKGAS